MPAAITAKVWALASGSNFTDLLTICVGLMSYVYWGATLFLLNETLNLTHGSPAPNFSFTNFRSWLPVILILNIPVLYYGTHRTTLVHTPEIFFAFLIVWFLVKNMPNRALGASLLLTALRVNDAPSIIFAIAARKQLSRLPKILISILILIGLFALSQRGYNGIHFKDFVFRYREKYNFGYGPLFTGAWGLFYTGPLWLLAFYGGIHRLRFDPSMIGAVFWLLAEYAIIVVWWGQGSDFGYRYLIGSYGAAFWVFIQDSQKTELLKNWGFRILSVIAALWMSWLTWIYKERPEFTPYPIRNNGWTHPRLQLNSLEALLDPSLYLVPLRHSPVATIYFTFIDPTGAYAMRGGMTSAPFLTLCLSTLAAIVLGVFCLVRLKTTQSKKSTYAT